MEQVEDIQIRDQREPGHFWADNEIVDEYLPAMGAYGFAVYMLLCRCARSGQCDCASIGYLADTLTISKPTVRSALDKLIELKLILRTERTDPKHGDLPNLYTLLAVKKSGGVNQIYRGSKPDLPGGVNQVDPIKTNNTNKILSGDSAGGVNWPTALDGVAFKIDGATAYYNNKPVSPETIKDQPSPFNLDVNAEFATLCKYTSSYTYIGRKSTTHDLPASPFANPFKINTRAKDKAAERKRVIDKYREYIYHNADLLKRIPELRGQKLVCYCHPQPCHGDILLELVKITDDELNKLIVEAEAYVPPAPSLAYNSEDVFDALAEVCFNAIEKADVKAVGGRVGPIRKSLIDHVLEKRKEKDLTEATLKELAGYIRRFAIWYDEKCNGCSRPTTDKTFMTWWVQYTAPKAGQTAGQRSAVDDIANRYTRNESGELVLKGRAS